MVTKRFLHLLTNDKFTRPIIEVYSRQKGLENHFWIVGHGRDASIGDSNVLSTTPREFHERAHLIKQFDFVLIHGFRPHVAKWLQNAGPEALRPVIVWLSWGYDVYNVRKETYLQTLLPKTRGMYLRRARTKIRWSLIKLGVLRNDYRLTQAVLGKIDYIAPVLPNEMPIIREIYRLPQRVRMARLSSWQYPEATEEFMETGKGILLGNSANFSSNLIEGLDVIANSEIGDREVILPVSYGNKDYRREVSRHGRSLFGDRVKQLQEFLPLADYTRLIRSCDVALFNNRRQQAMGNVYMMLVQGATVYLREENPAFEFLVGNGAIVRSVNELEQTGRLTLLVDEERRKNRRILKEMFSEGAVESMVETMARRGKPNGD